MIPKIRATLTLMAYEKNVPFVKGLSPDEKEVGCIQKIMSGSGDEIDIFPLIIVV